MPRKNPDRRAAIETPPRKCRAVPMPPTERRAAIIAATLPLLLAHGPTVTTRQIAEAAGIAEGTIFRVFPDIESLIQTAVDWAYDPAQIAADLAAISDVTPLDQRLIEAVRILQRRLTAVWQLTSMSGMPKPRTFGPNGKKKIDRPDVPALVALFEPDRNSLRRDPVAAAQLLRGLTLAGSHPGLVADGVSMEPEEIVSVLLDGMRTHTLVEA